MIDTAASETTLPKILVIYAHPESRTSIANQVMIKKIESLSHVTVHDLYAVYPDFFIDVNAEHRRLLEHDIIIFQHPLYMYSCPALLKEWFDRVVNKSFAFGEKSRLAGKVWRSVITTGGNQDAFGASGYNKYPLEQILQPFELTAALCKMQWVEPLVLYWSRNVSDMDRYQHAEQYRQWLLTPYVANTPHPDAIVADSSGQSVTSEQGGQDGA